MKLKSTRGMAPESNFIDAIFKGLAPDGGLYHPVEIKSLKSTFARLSADSSFIDVAKAVALPWLSDEWDEAAIDRIVKRAFSFEPALRKIDDNTSLLELFHGPSSAFKDFGACFLASCMEEALSCQQRRALILVATSGDTGSAVAQAFHNKHNIDVVILYPSGRVSLLQEKQLTTLGGNVHALEVGGSFDDCQRMVKEAFQKKDLADALQQASAISLTSANSISIGRLLPQSFYYVYAYAKLKDEIDGDLVVCVPSGNFGNLTAGVYAWTWGLSVKEFIAATNVNDVVPEYLKTELYSPRASVQTLSNAMDVGNPSNFERLQAIFENDARKMAEIIKGEVVTDSQTRETMAALYKSSGVFVDPHTAVGLCAAARYLGKDGRKKDHVVVLSTAHPAKFLEIVEETTGAQPEIPANIQKALKLPKQSVKVPNTLEALEEFLRNTFCIKQACI
ncbi:MAG: threonine synthase [Spirochaetaceae bacterium]|nr:MAG: threonine synthase [Spirochaetaceae bacterium]